MTPDPRNPSYEPYRAETLARYLSDPVFAAGLDAERDAARDAWFAEQDARRRAQQEAIWAADDLPDMELRA